MSIIVRHVIVAARENVLQIKESFFGFIPLINQNAENLDHEICNFLESNNISIEKCRSQG